jgi:hypothetical protein
VKDLDGQVLALLAQHLLELLLEDLSCAVVRVHHLIADLVDRRRALDLKVLDDFIFDDCVANDALLRIAA